MNGVKHITKITLESDDMTNLEIVERAMKFIHDPDWEFHECVALYLASQLAQEHPTNKSDATE